MAASDRRAGLASHFDLDVDLRNHVLTPYGELDALSSRMLLAAAAAFIAQVPGDLTLDLANVVSADAAMLEAVVEIRATLRDHGARLTLANQPPSVLRLVLASGIRQVWS